MKYLILLLAAVSVTYAQFNNIQFAPQVSPLTRIVPVLSRSEVRDDFGQYSLSYQSADGTGVSDQGVLKPNSEGQYVLVRQGSYSYTSPEGTPITVNYIADENGFQPTGTHLPKSVPVQY